jgi:plasmid stabilization system protein ParE
MNEVLYTEQALNDLERVSDFLLDSDRAAALATVGIIFEALDILTHSPEIGRKIRGGNRELVISRGSSGYLALYRFLPVQQRVLVLAVRHQRESGYKSA